LKTLKQKYLETKLKRTVLPTSGAYFVPLFENHSFRKFLKTDATKDEGMNVVAKYYKVEQDWNDYKNSIGMHHTRPEKYLIS
jgi:hypothetical protein